MNFQRAIHKVFESMNLNLFRVVFAIITRNGLQSVWNITRINYCKKTVNTNWKASFFIKLE